MSAVLAVREAVKRFGHRQALDGASLTLQRGEIYALLGPNGAGKTTLIRAICGRVRLDSGEVELAGRLGLVPQEIALYPALTARENLEVLGRLAGVGRGELRRAVDHALAWTELTARAGERVDRLSGGMQRRLNLAAGTLHGPSLLLLDEPTVGVDPHGRDEIHDLLERLRDDGLAVLITTHDLEQAERLADRIGILVDGRLHAEGSLDQLVLDSHGGSRQLHVVLANSAGGAATELLSGAGLARAADGVTWNGPWGRDLDAVSELSSRISALGLTATEIRLREAGLREVFFRVTGREFTP